MQSIGTPVYGRRGLACKCIGKSPMAYSLHRIRANESSPFHRRLSVLIGQRFPSKAAAAKCLGCSESHVCLLLRGRRGFDLQNIVDWSQRLGLSDAETASLLRLGVTQVVGPRGMALLAMTLTSESVSS